jgi:hypothetical protein
MASLSFGRDPVIAFASAPRQRNHVAKSSLMPRGAEQPRSKPHVVILPSITEAGGTAIPTFDA